MSFRCDDRFVWFSTPRLAAPKPIPGARPVPVWFARGEADAASRAKDEFLATFLHELRTILGLTHVLQKHLSELGELSKGVDTIERSARSQSRLIEDLLDMNLCALFKTLPYAHTADDYEALLPWNIKLTYI